MLCRGCFRVLRDGGLVRVLGFGLCVGPLLCGVQCVCVRIHIYNPLLPEFDLYDLIVIGVDSLYISDFISDTPERFRM